MSSFSSSPIIVIAWRHQCLRLCVCVCVWGYRCSYYMRAFRIFLFYRKTPKCIYLKLNLIIEIRCMNRMIENGENISTHFIHNFIHSMHRIVCLHWFASHSYHFNFHLIWYAISQMHNQHSGRNTLVRVHYFQIGLCRCVNLNAHKKSGEKQWQRVSSALLFRYSCEIGTSQFYIPFLPLTVLDFWRGGSRNRHKR